MIVITSSVKTSIVRMGFNRGHGKIWSREGSNQQRSPRDGVERLTNAWRYAIRRNINIFFIHSDFSVSNSGVEIRQQYKNHIAYKWQKQATIHSCFDGGGIGEAG